MLALSVNRPLLFSAVKIHLDFLQTHKIGNIGIIANTVFRYICSFLLYLHHMMLENVKLDVSE